MDVSSFTLYTHLGLGISSKEEQKALEDLILILEKRYRVKPEMVENEAVRLEEFYYLGSGLRLNYRDFVQLSAQPQFHNKVYLITEPGVHPDKNYYRDLRLKAYVVNDVLHIYTGAITPLPLRSEQLAKAKAIALAAFGKP